MKKHYDFSKGEKGKFYIPEKKIELPDKLKDNVDEKEITYWSEEELESLSKNSFHYVIEDCEDYTNW